MFPEGFITPLVLVLLVTVAGMCVQNSSWSKIQIPVALIAALAAIAGSVLARLRVADAVAHLFALVVGAALPLLLVLQVADLGMAPRATLRELGTEGVDWYLGDSIDPHVESLLVSLIMGFVLWLVGYLAGWALFRRGWLLPTLVLPGFLVLVNLGYADDPDTRYLLVYAGLALILVTRHFWFQQRQQWHRARMVSSGGVSSMALTAGLVIALGATIVGAVAPSSLSQATFQPLMDESWTQMQSAQERVASWIDGSGEPLTAADVADAGSYAAFDDAFSVGGPLNLGDDPQVLVSADWAPYLTAQTFDAYTGRGWQSTTEETFDPTGEDGKRYSPQMTFAPNQRVPLSDDATKSRTPNTVIVTPLVPTNGRLFTVDTYESSSVQSSVQMSWLQLDGVEIDLTSGDLSQVPTDLRGFVTLLMNSELTGEDQGKGPTANNAALQSEIDSQSTQLRQRFLSVTWSADDAGMVESITVTGQIPVYDDVDSVFARQGENASSAYQVVASSSTATGEDLATAGMEYPEWVTDRYLSLPDTTTARTQELAQTITADARNPYEAARAIEAYIRDYMVYDENVEEPPAGADIVDYLLFEDNHGYCEYSASAMTVLLRMMGIPARVAVGFYPGDYDANSGAFLYLQSNAHAWTEVFFPGYGWIPFEPTPSQPLLEAGAERESDNPDTEVQPTQTAGNESTAEVTEPTVDASTPVDPASDDLTLGPQVTPEGSEGGFTIPWLWVGLGAGIALLAASIAMAWFLPLRGVPMATSLFLRLRRIGGWMGVKPPPSSTPREFGRAFVKQVPVTRGHVERIVKTYEVDQYGPQGADARWLRGAEDAWSTIRRQVWRWPFRWRPRWFSKGEDR